jgi:hypothetical protein
MSKTNLEGFQTATELICNRYFIVEIPNIDSFLVESVKRSPYIKKNRDCFSSKNLEVVLINAIAPSTHQQVESIIDAGGFIKSLTIKYFDKCGTIIGGVIYENVHLERVDYDMLSYNDPNQLSRIKLTLSYDKEKNLFKV